MRATAFTFKIMNFLCLAVPHTVKDCTVITPTLARNTLSMLLQTLARISALILLLLKFLTQYCPPSPQTFISTKTLTLR